MRERLSNFSVAMLWRLYTKICDVFRKDLCLPEKFYDIELETLSRKSPKCGAYRIGDLVIDCELTHHGEFTAMTVSTWPIPFFRTSIVESCEAISSEIVSTIKECRDKLPSQGEKYLKMKEVLDVILTKSFDA